jgi:hypothetical protein
MTTGNASMMIGVSVSQICKFIGDCYYIAPQVMTNPDVTLNGGMLRLKKYYWLRPFRTVALVKIRIVEE